MGGGNQKDPHNLLLEWSEFSNLFVEQVTISLVKEYLLRKNHRKTLRAFHGEDPGPGVANGRALLATKLHLQHFLNENKRKGEGSELASILEVLVKGFILYQNKAYSDSDNNQYQKRETKSRASQTLIKTDKRNGNCPNNAELINNLLTSTKNLRTQKTAEDEEEYSSSDFLDPVESPPLSPLTLTDSEEEKEVAVKQGVRNSTSPNRKLLNRSMSKPSISHRDDYNFRESYDEEEKEEEKDNPGKMSESFETEFQVKKKEKIPENGESNDKDKDKSSEAEKEPASISLAESLLLSKQNILAKGLLTSKEIEKRSKGGRRRSLSEDKIVSQTRKIGEMKLKSALTLVDESEGRLFEKEEFPKRENFEEKASSRRGRRESDGMFFAREKFSSQPQNAEKGDGILCDIEDEDFHWDERQKNLIHFSKRKPKHELIRSKVDNTTWKKLKICVLGVKGFIQDGWRGQGFNFNKDVPFGLVQRKGGPCGVLASVQALLLRNLLFGSGISKKEDSLPLSETEIKILLEGSFPSRSIHNFTSRRNSALVSALTEILWGCRPNEKCEKPTRVLLALQGYEPGSDLIGIETLEQLREFVEENLHQIDCLGLTYSAVLTRGVERVEEDMDFGGSAPLLGQHGYCSQELINLLLFGKGVSNVFNNNVTLDGKELQGIAEQANIGLLSLFEHYGSCEVGSFMKSPKYPVWIVCSESHFSVLFTPNEGIVKDRDEIGGPFDLFYYDGLAKQEGLIRLTIAEYHLNHDPMMSRMMSSISINDPLDHIIPPLEKCIRTKWRNAKISWNGTEPLL